MKFLVAFHFEREDGDNGYANAVYENVGERIEAAKLPDLYAFLKSHIRDCRNVVVVINAIPMIG